MLFFKNWKKSSDIGKKIRLCQSTHWKCCFKVEKITPTFFPAGPFFLWYCRWNVYRSALNSKNYSWLRNYFLVGFSSLLIKQLYIVYQIIELKLQPIKNLDLISGIHILRNRHNHIVTDRCYRSSDFLRKIALLFVQRNQDLEVLFVFSQSLKFCAYIICVRMSRFYSKRILQVTFERNFISWI